MFALVFRFPAGRYHATPWGRHVNEGDVAWPPEPYRILRALIATWHRTADRARYGEDVLARLIEALAGELPLFGLPDAVHAHTRHYMPQGRLAKGREETKLVFDAFLRILPTDRMISAWQATTLPAESFDLAAHLTERMNYFGRAESLVYARSERDLDWESCINSRPDGPAGASTVAVDVLAALSPQAYAAERPGLLALNSDKPKSKKRLAFEATVPVSLFKAVQVETSALQAAGWSQPPGGRFVRYHRPEIGPRPPARRIRPTPLTKLPKVARLVLAGRPLPRIEDAVKIGEVFRTAIMARMKGEIPAVISGREAGGKPSHDPQHGHAFFLPEDHDCDGFIDHLVLYIRDGLPPEVASALDKLRSLWIAAHRRRDFDNPVEDGRMEWRLAVEGFGEPAEFAGSALLRPSAGWTSVSPYLRPWHMKSGDVARETKEMVRKECRLRGLPLNDVEFERSGRDDRICAAEIDGRSVLRFHRFRSRRGLVQPDRSGSALHLAFEKPVCGPIALGFGCHYGLGLFAGSS
jgi:CRISPR-associated protein Csb2